MGNCASQSAIEAPSTPEKQRSAAIDRQIAEDERNFKKECKILLLGSGESGKSTIVKQMKIIHLHGYSPDELLLYRSVVNRNVVESAQALVLAMRKFGLDCQHSANRVRYLSFLSLYLFSHRTNVSYGEALLARCANNSGIMFRRVSLTILRIIFCPSPCILGPDQPLPTPNTSNDA